MKDKYYKWGCVRKKGKIVNKNKTFDSWNGIESSMNIYGIVGSYCTSQSRLREYIKNASSMNLAYSASNIPASIVSIDS